MEIRSRMRGSPSTLLDRAILVPAIGQSFVKLDPRWLVRNPIMFVLESVAALTTVILARELAGGSAHLWFTVQITVWLWITVLFANFAEAVAEGRGKAQAATLRRARTRQWRNGSLRAATDATIPTACMKMVAAPDLKPGDVVLVEAGGLIPSDGEVIEGIASVDESAITGESAPVIRESGGDRSAVTGGTRVLSDWIKVRITAARGSTFLDRMTRSWKARSVRRRPTKSR
jgi:K+-transporting ATPase ATPase B chain